MPITHLLSDISRPAKCFRKRWKTSYGKDPKLHKSIVAVLNSVGHIQLFYIYLYFHMIFFDSKDKKDSESLLQRLKEGQVVS